MKKVFAALLMLCLLVSAADGLLLRQAVAEEVEEAAIPIFSETFSGTAVYMRLFSDAKKESRRQGYAGPGDAYDTAGAYKPYKQRGIVAYFTTGDYVFVRLSYQTVEDRYLYFWRSSFNSLENVPELTELSYWNGTTTSQITPSWGPGYQYSTESEYVIYAKTPVKVFFEENNFVYAEFFCANGLVRMWLPKGQVDIQPQQLPYTGA